MKEFVTYFFALVSSLWAGLFIFNDIRDFYDSDSFSFQMLDLSNSQILWMDGVEIICFLLLLFFLFFSWYRRKLKYIWVSIVLIILCSIVVLYVESLHYYRI